MNSILNEINKYYEIYEDKIRKKERSFSNTSFALDGGEIMCLPRPDGDERYPYGEDGFNFWAYTSGYMHANDGLFSVFLRAETGADPKVAFFVAEDAGVPISLLPVPVLSSENGCGGKDGLKVKRFTVFSGKKVMYFAQFGDLRSRVSVKVFADKTIGFAVDIINLGDGSKNVRLSSYIDPYLRNSISPSSEDKWFRKGRVVEVPVAECCEETVGAGKCGAGRLPSFVFTVNEDVSRTESVTNIGVINRRFIPLDGVRLCYASETVSGSAYKGGIHGSLHTIKMVPRDGVMGPKSEMSPGDGVMGPKVCAFTENAIAGDLLEFSLESGAVAGYEASLLFMTARKDESVVEELIARGTDNEENFGGGAVEEESGEKSNDVEGKHTAGLDDDGYDFEVSFAHPNESAPDSGIMNAFMGTLSRQVEFCSLIKGFVQLSPNSMIGIRDVFQALEGYIYLNPQRAADKMLEALDYVVVNGRCPRQYSLPSSPGIMPRTDLREFIDQGCWVIDCIVSYLKLTGDMDFLDRSCGYIEITDEDAGNVARSAERGTVLDHMERIMDYLLSNQDEKTGCIKILFGDWNDAIDGLGVSLDGEKKFGNGVSVMVSLQVYRNLSDMIELLHKVGGESKNELISRYELCQKRLKNGLIDNAIIGNPDVGSKEDIRRIVHGWGDKKSYYVGSFCDPDKESRYGLSSYAFWVLGGMNRVCDMKKEMLTAYDALDSKYGYRTFAPPFGRDVKGVGRIYKLPPGTAENGASYIHATTFAIMSLFMTGEGERAWEQIMKIVPFTHEHLSCSPFVMPNSYGYNPELNIDGESMQDWQTGSSNVLFKTIVGYVLGFRPGYDALMICPAAYCPYNGFSYRALYRGKTVRVKMSPGDGVRGPKTEMVPRDGVKGPKRGFIVNGVSMPGIYDKTMKTYKLLIKNEMLSDDNTIEIIDL